MQRCGAGELWRAPHGTLAANSNPMEADGGYKMCGYERALQHAPKSQALMIASGQT
jgi:hypothetical protein